MVAHVGFAIKIISMYLINPVYCMLGSTSQEEHGFYTLPGKHFFVCLLALLFWVDINTLLLCSLNDLALCALGNIGLSTGECDKNHS